MSEELHELLKDVLAPIPILEEIDRRLKQRDRMEEIILVERSSYTMKFVKLQNILQNGDKDK